MVMSQNPTENIFRNQPTATAEKGALFLQNQINAKYEKQIASLIACALVTAD
mgnify:CR=1 FL=1